MFYETKDNKHGLPHDPFKSCVVPRPIGWISTLSKEGIVNLAPYSFFNAVASEPPMVLFANNGRQSTTPGKDTITNCEETGEFVYNVATWDLREKMNLSSAGVPSDVDEFEYAGLETAPSRLVKPPRVAAAPIHLECVYHQTVELPCDREGERNAICIGRVVGVHIDESVLTDGLVDVTKYRPLARLGYMDYTSTDYAFTMYRPTV